MGGDIVSRIPKILQFGNMVEIEYCFMHLSNILGLKIFFDAHSIHSLIDAIKNSSLKIYIKFIED